MNLRKWIAEKLLQVKASPAPDNAMMPANGFGQFVNVGGTITWISDNLAAYITDGYSSNDIVYAGVNMVMDKVRVAPWSIYKVVDESSLKKYEGLISGKWNANTFSQAMGYRKKALEPITSMNRQVGKIADLLKWPNENQTWQEQVAEGVGWMMIDGNEMLVAKLLPLGANVGLPQELNHAPSQYTTVIAKRGFPPRIVGFYLSLENLTFERNEVLHVKTWNPNYDTNGSSLLGMAPLKAARKTLTRNNSLKKASSVEFENNGAAGIAYIDEATTVLPADRKSQADAVKRVWANEYTGAQNYGKVAFSGYKMNYVAVGRSLKEMDATTMENIDLRRLFNIWGIPSQLGNDPDNKTYNSLVEAEKALTTRCALPYMTRKRDHFNMQLQKRWGMGGNNIYADFDMSVYTELQEDQKEKWEWVNKLPVSSAYKLELMGMDVPDDPNLDVILIDGNMVPLSDVVNRLSDTELDNINNELNKSGLNDYLRVAK